MRATRFIGPIASRYGSVAVQMLVIAVIAHSLDAQGAARYFTFMGLVLTTYFWVGGGLPDGIVREVPALRAVGQEAVARALVKVAWRRTVLTLPIGFSLVSVAAFLISREVGTAIGVGAWWTSYAIIFSAAQITVAAGSAGIGTTLFYSSANLGQLLVTVPAVLAFSTGTLQSVTLLTGLGTMLAALVAAAVALRTARKLDSVNLSGRELDTRSVSTSAFRVGIQIAIGRCVQAVIIWSPVWIAVALLTARNAADIGLAARLVSAVAGVIAAVRFSVRPELAAAAAVGEWLSIQRAGRSIAILATGLALSAVIATIAVGPIVISAIFGTEYGAVWLFTAILLLGTVGESVGGPVDEILKMSGDAGFVLGAQLGAMVAVVGLQTVGAIVAGPELQSVAYVATFSALYLALIIRLRLTRKITILPIKSERL